jgi:hypothetical protein
MPIDYRQYPQNWKTEIRPAILERDGHCCKFCGVANYAAGYRDRLGQFIELSPMESEARSEDGLNQIVIVLTIAHLDHDINNNDYSNLAALCQRCHLRYDAEHHAKNSAATRRAKKDEKEAKSGQIKLF